MHGGRYPAKGRYLRQRPAWTGLGVVAVPEWSGTDSMETSMPTSKSKKQAPANEPSDTAPVNLNGAAQRQDRLSVENKMTSSPQATRSAQRNLVNTRKPKKDNRRVVKKPSKARSTRVQTSLRKSATKAELIVTLLHRSCGTSIAEIMKATGWQAHSVRGFVAATVKKQMGLSLVSERPDGKDRRYRIV
jgi:hypothetical protein